VVIGNNRLILQNLSPVPAGVLLIILAYYLGTEWSTGLFINLSRTLATLALDMARCLAKSNLVLSHLYQSEPAIPLSTEENGS